jgi:hypothetical protein
LRFAVRRADARNSQHRVLLKSIATQTSREYPMIRPHWDGDKLMHGKRYMPVEVLPEVIDGEATDVTPVLEDKT